VLQTAWKDNNLVLFLSTIHYPVELDSEIVRILQAKTKPGNLIAQALVIRNRKRPRATSIAAKSVRAEFGDAVQKNLAIPCSIDEYKRPSLRRETHPVTRRIYSLDISSHFLTSLQNYYQYITVF
jgi:hypothetical protein